VTSSDTGYFDLHKTNENKGRVVGGGLILYNITVTVSDALIEDCTAVAGGGVYIRNSPSPPASNGSAPAQVVQIPGSGFARVRFKNCSAVGLPKTEGRPKGGGGAVLIKDAFVEFVKCHFDHNHTEGQFVCGGGVYAGVQSRAMFDECIFADNKAEAEGGGLYCHMALDYGDEHRSGVILRGCTLIRNQATGSGGAISAYNSRIKLVNSTFSDNKVLSMKYENRRSGAIGGAVYLNYDTKYTPNWPIVIDDCLFSNNQAFSSGTVSAHEERSFAGGALAIASGVRMDTSKLQLRALIFDLNQAFQGAHVALPSASVFEGWKGTWDPRSNFTSPGREDAKAIYTFPSGKEQAAQLKPPAIDSRWGLPADCFDDRPSSATIRAVVIHFISAVKIRPNDPFNFETILAIFKGEAEPNSGKVSAHYLIDHGGTIYRLVDDVKRAWHAGLSKMPNGEEDVNNFSIGIEMMRKADEAPTDAQYEALASLLLDLKRRHQAIAKDSIVGHDMIRALWNKSHPERMGLVKDDPGLLFHWSRLFKKLDELGFDTVK